MSIAAGVINIHKEKGFTSHDVVNIVRGITKCKAGHTGTLDPNATGVLPVCLGRATKIADYIMGGEKEYVAEVIFGASTNTQDATGEIIAEKPMTADLPTLKAALTDFLGEITQLPPMYSAIKVGGKKLYEYARTGAEVEVKPRQVFVHEIELLEANLPQAATIRVRCSKGTYIRTICADLGEKLGTLAHMGDLLRTKSGGFCISNSITLDKLKELTQAGRLQEVVTPIEQALKHLPKISIDAKADKWLQNGNKIPLAFVAGLTPPYADEYLTFDARGNLAGIFTVADLHVKPKVMLQ